MSALPNCYEDIIGLSRTTCDCYDIPSDASTSLSGLYIDELASLNSLQAITDCETGTDVFEQLRKARDLAIISFQADTNALLMQTNKLRRNNYKGAIGRGVAKNTISPTIGQYYGIRLWCNNIKSGVLHLTSIGSMFTQTGTKTLYIYNNLGDLLHTITLSTLAGKQKQTVVDIELPLHSDYIENLEYFFIYESDANVAMGNDLKCNCGGFKPVFNTHKPYCYSSQNDRNYMWSQWMMVGGFHSVDLPDFDDCNLGHTTTNLLYGLTIDVELKCLVNEVLCMDGIDFESNNLAGAMAIAIQNKSAVIVGNWIVNSGKLNRMTMINTEILIEDIKQWSATYVDMIKYIAAEADLTVNDCLVCKDILEMTRRGILT